METRTKISVSLTFELIKAIEDNVGTYNRSSFIELGMRDYLLDAHGVRVPLPKGDG